MVIPAPDLYVNFGFLWAYLIYLVSLLTSDSCWLPPASSNRYPATMSTSARRRLMRDFKVCILWAGLALWRFFLFFFWGVADMSMSGQLTLLDNHQRMQTDPPAGVSASPVADNVMTW